MNVGLLAVCVLLGLVILKEWRGGQDGALVFERMFFHVTQGFCSSRVIQTSRSRPRVVPG